MAKFTIKVTATLNGKPCKNPKVEFLQGEVFLYPCKIKNGEIEFEIKPGINPNVCIEGYIKCDDECLNCPPQYFKKCLCNDVTLLEACQKCVDGFIVDTCTPAQIAAGLICTPDGCTCPPSSPLTDPNTGQCVQCITGTKDGCKICVAGHWEDMVCPTGERCENGVCNCPAGYIRDTFTGLCVVIPECVDDSACGPCEICVSGNCKPVVCPDKHKCVNGECIYWPCIDTSCGNGADCGEECGCLKGECVPCYLLPCTEEGCQSAYGCGCATDNKCHPLNNCSNEYCDNENPCQKPGCTCYDFHCVDCGNFPCSGDGSCESYQGCGCNEAGDCVGGGEPCINGGLKLEKKIDCDKKDCRLEATIPSSDCKCDPIIFKTVNTLLPECDPSGNAAGFGGSGVSTFDQEITVDTSTPAPSLPDTILKLNVGMFKRVNNIDHKYADYKNNYNFGDNELVSGNIEVRITHKYYNKIGVLTPVTMANNIITSGITDNLVSVLYVTKNNVKEVVVVQGVPYPTFVTVEVFAKSIKIDNNNCKNYETPVLIAKYELDYKDDATRLLTCNKIRGVYYLEKQVAFVRDYISSRYPRLTWFRSNTTQFETNSRKYLYNGEYGQYGWFRKLFVKNKNADGLYYDYIKTPTEDPNATSIHGELLGNYHYMVKTDCGCGRLSDAQQEVHFCCPEDFEYKFSNCNKKLTVDQFTVCDPNGRLSDFESTLYKLPNESQVHYKLKVELSNGAEEVSEFTYTNKNTLGALVYESKVAGATITSASIYQVYNGGVLGGKELCIYTIEADEIKIPTINPVVTCSKDVIGVSLGGLVSTGWEIVSIKDDKNNTYSKPVASVNLFQFNYRASALTSYLNDRGRTLTILFKNGCETQIKTKPCEPSLTLTAQSMSAKACGGDGGTIEAVVTLFPTGPVEVTLTSGGQTYTQSLTNGVPYTFDGLDAGEYIATALQGVLSANDSESVLATENTTVTIDKESICQGESAKITVFSAPGEQFTFTLPNGSSSTITTGIDGLYVSSPLTMQGTYTVSARPGGNACYPFVATKQLTVGGQVLSPSIEVQPGSYCVGQPIPFRIIDNGVFATYQLDSMGSGVFKDNSGAVITQLQASNTYDAVFLPNSVNSLIKIALPTGSCNTMQGNVQIPITAALQPTMSNVTAQCAGDNTHTVSLNTTATAVTIGGVAATNVGGTLWQRVGITGLTSVDVVITGGGCSATQTVTLQNCLCPSGEVWMKGNNTCGQGTATLEYDGSTLSGSITNSWTYKFQRYDSFPYPGGWTDITIPANFSLPAIPSTQVPTTIGVTDSYRIVITNPVNGCSYQSLGTDIGAVMPPSVTISPSVPMNNNQILQGTAVSFSTQQGYESYTWGGAVSGNTYQSNSVSLPIGNHQVTLEVCSAESCCTTITYNFEVIQNCTIPIILGYPQGSGCSDITLDVSGGVGELYYTVYDDNGYLTNTTPTLVPALGPITIPTLLVPPGETSLIVVTITDANGCSVSTPPSYEYTKCSCICDGQSCLGGKNYSMNVLSGTVTTFNVGTFSGPIDYAWHINNAGTSPTNYVIKVDGSVIFETGFISKAVSTCGFVGCPSGTEYLGDIPLSTYTLVTGGTGTTAALNTTPTCNQLFTNLGYSSFLKGLITIPAGVVTIEITKSTCGSAGFPNGITLECV